MPSGGIPPLSVITKALFDRKERIRRILDVGVGFGKYGVLFREYLELWDGREKHRKEDWLRIIDGIEANEAYISPLHRYIYNNIYVGEAWKILSTMPSHSYDLLLLADVLEHFEKPRGFEVLGQSLRVASWVIVSVPEKAEPYNTGPFGLFYRPWRSKYEIHRSHWDKEDFLRISKNTHFLPCEDYIVASMNGV